MRLMAEFDTFRRRTSEEKLALVNSAAKDTIKGLLPVLDDCERAMELLSKSSDESAKEGTALIYDKLMKYLKSKGLEKSRLKDRSLILISMRLWLRCLSRMRIKRALSMMLSRPVTCSVERFSVMPRLS